MSTLKLQDTGLEYEERGTGEPVLLIHGSHIAGSFLPLLAEPALTERYRLVRYHRRGFAGSDRAPGPFSIQQQAADAETVLDALGIERAHIVGHSYGAATALQLALDAPSSVASLVLLEPPLMTPEDFGQVATALGPSFEAFGSGDVRGAVDSFMTFVCGADWRAESEAAVPGGPQQAEDDAATFFEVEVPALGEWTFDQAHADRLSQPVLFVLGDESAPMFGQAQKLFASLVPDAKQVVLPGVNHLMQMRNSRLVTDAMIDFFADHPIAART